MSAFMDRIQERVSARSAKRAAFEGKTRQNIQFNRFDRQMWGKIRQNDTVDHDITDLMVGDPDEERIGYDNAPELLQDLCYALYKPDPQPVPERNVEKDARLNRAILSEVQKSPYYHELREYTMLDETMTTIALFSMADAVREILLRNQESAQQSNQDKSESGDEMNDENNRTEPQSPEPQSPAQPSEEDGEEGDDQDEGQGEGEGQEGESEGQGQGQGQGPGEGENEGEEGNQGSSGQPAPNPGDPNQDERQPEQGSESPGPDHDREFENDPDLGDEHEGGGEVDEDLAEDITQAINQAMSEAATEADELEGLRKSVGLEDGEWRQMSPEERLKRAEQLRTPAMKEVADMVGRMKRFAMGQQATKVVDVPNEPVDIEQGDNLRHLLASEYALLDDEDTEWEFYRRYVDKTLLQYKLRGTAKAGKGPIVACIDKSYSMSGRPFVWAMGVAEALRRICQEQKRDYHASFFGTNDDHHEFSFPQGAADFGKVIDFLSCEANGGTEFDGVLERSLARITEQHDNGLTKADIVFITDGQANLGEEWLKEFNEEKERTGCRVFGIYIGGASDMYSSHRKGPETLALFSDLVIPVSDLQVDAMRDVFAQV
jgi:uncharacterized protein with von Willebrand factor type A (vWA) domain